MTAPRSWIEKRVQWSRPRSIGYPQPPKGQPYILFAACILPEHSTDALQFGPIPAGYTQFLTMCSPVRVAAPETVHKSRQTTFKNQVAKKTAGMLPIGRDLVEARLREKKDADYFDFQTAVATQKYRAGVWAEIMDGKDAEIMESMEQLDAHPELRVEVFVNAAVLGRQEVA